MFNKFLEKKSELRSKINSLKETNDIDSEALNLIQKDIERDLKISVFAEMSNGKSTFLNALIFEEEFLHAGIGEVTFAVFTLSYGETPQLKIDGKEISVSNEEDILEEIKKINLENRENKSLSYVDIKINNKKLEGICIVDTPGFGSLNEENLEDAFIKIVANSDGVIFIFDIAKGAKAEDLKRQEKYLKNIEKDKQWIVFNKLDAVKEKDEAKIQLAEDTLKALSMIPKEKKIHSYGELKEYKTYPLSSQKALEARLGIGYDRRNNQFKLSDNEIKEDFDDSRFGYFEQDFLAQLPKEKYHFLLTLEDKINKEKQKQQLELDKNIDELKIRVVEKKEDALLIKNMQQKSINEIQDLKSNWSILKLKYKKTLEVIARESEKKKEYLIIDDMIKTISDEIINKISLSLDDFSITDSFSAKEKTTELINNALENSEPLIAKELKKYSDYRLKDILSSIVMLEGSISHFNSNKTIDIKKPSALNLDGHILKVNDALNNKQNQNMNLNINNIDLDSLLNPILATIVGIIVALIVEFIMTRFAVAIIPVAGQIIGAVVGIGTLFFGDSIATKIKKKVMPEVKETIPKVVKESILIELIDPLNRELSNIKLQLNNLLKDSELKIDSLINILGKKHRNKEEELKKFNNSILIIQEKITNIRKLKVTIEAI